MTKFELARTAGRWRPRSRTYVALAILFVTAWPTNARVGAANRKTERRRNVIRHRSVGLREMLDVSNLRTSRYASINVARSWSQRPVLEAGIPAVPGMT